MAWMILYKKKVTKLLQGNMHNGYNVVKQSDELIILVDFINYSGFKLKIDLIALEIVFKTKYIWDNLIYYNLII